MTRSDVLVVLVLFLTSLCCTGYDRGPKRFLYYNREDGCLRRHVMKTHQYTSEMGCLMACQNNKDCMSVNILKTSDTGLVHCEINDKRRGLVDQLDFHLDYNYEYYELQTMHPMMDGRLIQMPAESCHELYNRRELFGGGIYPIRCGKKSYPTYCSSTIKDCDKGGWTLVAKIDGNKDTFKYDSKLWTSKKAYLLDNVLKGLDHTETLQPTYWNTRFDKLCLGMRTHDGLKWIMVPLPASRSLYDVIVNGTLKPFNVNGSLWSSFIDDQELSPCLKQGVNLKGDVGNISLRIGVVSANVTFNSSEVNVNVTSSANASCLINGTSSINATGSTNGTGPVNGSNMTINGTALGNQTVPCNGTDTGNSSLPVILTPVCHGPYYRRIGVGLDGSIGGKNSDMSSGYSTFDYSTNQEADTPMITYIFVQ